MSPQGQGDSEIVNEPRVESLMRLFVQSFREAAPATFAEFGENKSQEFVNELKFKITAQLFQHAPLSRAYYLWKLKNRLDPRILIQTGEYVDAITYERDADETRDVVFHIGMRRGMHSQAHVPYAQLAKWLEFGTRHMPARPHWRPQIRNYQSRIDLIGQELRANLTQRVRSGMQQ